MAEILGLTVSHFPYLRFKYWAMPSVMRGLVGGPWADKPQGDISKWPEAMRKEWGDDLGETAGTQAQARQVERSSAQKFGVGAQLRMRYVIALDFTENEFVDVVTDGDWARRNRGQAAADGISEAVELLRLRPVRLGMTRTAENARALGAASLRRFRNAGLLSSNQNCGYRPGNNNNHIDQPLR